VGAGDARIHVLALGRVHLGSLALPGDCEPLRLAVCRDHRLVAALVKLPSGERQLIKVWPVSQPQCL
jgi:hypothetical protein